LTLLVVLAVLASFRTLFGREAGVALLAAMMAMKLLEARTLRDGWVLLLLGYFLVMSNLLYSQSPPMAVYLCGVLIVLVAAQIMVQQQHSALPMAGALRLSLRMVLHALPVMLILFVLFPRIPGPLWGMPKDAHSGLTGLDEKMTPGTISQLIGSPEVAFRVRFAGPMPHVSQLYWRGPVLWRYDGTSWTRSDELPRPQFPYSVQGEGIGYTVVLEPHGKRWLFALDVPYSLPPETGLTSTFEMLRRNPVNELTRYQVRSYPNYQTDDLEPAWRWRALQLPPGNPRARALALEWRNSQAEPPGIVRAALNYVREQPFFYTLEPPAGLVEHNVDHFLFETRRGFCEHFAGSFVFLMRAAGIPARVVTGYQGGETNDLGGYFIVRQSDAHAWAEVWLQGQGWVRVDPTAAVSPARIESGIQAAVNPGGLPFMARRGASLLHDLALGWDSLNNLWNEWVLAYGPERQTEFLSGLGLGPVDWRGMTTGMIVALGLLSLLFAAVHFLNRLAVDDPVVRLYQRFCNKLARRGLVRKAHEGPLDFSERAALRHPQWAVQIRRIGRFYAGLRYGRAAPDKAAVRQLRQLIGAFKF
jgi:transglutaminase-like putative cysteine protease